MQWTTPAASEYLLGSLDDRPIETRQVNIDLYATRRLHLADALGGCGRGWDGAGGGAAGGGGRCGGALQRIGVPCTYARWCTDYFKATRSGYISGTALQAVNIRRLRICEHVPRRQTVVAREQGIASSTCSVAPAEAAAVALADAFAASTHTSVQLNRARSVASTVKFTQ